MPITKEEPLKLELQHFVECVRAQQTPVVSGESAKRALDLAFEIGIPLLADVLNPIAVQELREGFQSILDALSERWWVDPDGSGKTIHVELAMSDQRHQAGTG